ncbi:MAG: prepilin-type N-terminal cleavage/methylation domain-containing protein [Planctomycetota bacterium]|nr:prepilin-type N-terminal cleavage/methylation domain-containing protein [Planctomycetota bacterium]
MQRQRRLTPVRPAKGFTLVELLMVVLIISILVAILMPVIVNVIRGVGAVKTQARITSLATGAVTFYKDNGFYPGQCDLPNTWGRGINQGFHNMKTRLESADATTGLTGSQVLARALFYNPDETSAPTSLKSNYAQYVPDETCPTDPAISSRDYTIGDCWPKKQAMAICYYPARIGVAGMKMYKEEDNKVAYTEPNRATTDTFANAIKHPAIAGIPVKVGQFILLAPGLDRQYFNADDVTNYAGQ